MTIAERIATIQKKIHPAQILVVTKGRSVAEIQELLNSNVSMIGENKLQEIQKKYDLSLFHHMRRNGVAFHFIGHLQSNKVNKVVELCDVIESVDSLKLARAVSTAALGIGKRVPIFLELALTGEPQKFGFTEEQLNAVFSKITQLPGLNVRGFMTMGKEGDPKKTRVIFQRCRMLAKRHGLSELSMGMSDDYGIAVEEGATIVRLGRIIFEGA